MAGKRRPSAYTQIISEQQKDQPENQQPRETLQSDDTTISQSDTIIKSASDKNTISQNDSVALPQSDIAIKPDNDKSVISQNDNIVTSQNDAIILSQNDTPTSPQSTSVICQEKKQKRTERERLTYYLDPSQVDKLEDMRTAYRRATGKRLSEQELMRLIVDRLELSMLL